jgi:hypothetical protein
MLTLEHIMDALRLAPRYLVAVGIFCGFFLFLPEQTARQIGIFDFSQHYRQWIGVTFLAAISLVAVTGSLEVITFIRELIARKNREKRMCQALHRLTEEEKQILRFYYAMQSKTNTLRTDDGVVNGLVAKGIIHRAASLGNILEGFAHNIDERAWEVLHEKPELLEGTTNTYRTDKRERGLW